jgi:RNA polymerase sigma factor (sigma-70 family)
MFTTVSALLSRLPGLQDGDAWGVFHDRYSPLLTRFYRSYGLPLETARDLAADTIERVVGGLSEGEYVRQKGRLRDWISGISRNVLKSYLRRRKTRLRENQGTEAGLSDHEDPSATAGLDSVEDRFDAIWVRARLSALLRLANSVFSTVDLRCYFLVEIRRLPVAKVAERLDLSPSSVFAKRRAVADWLLAVAPRFVSRWEH